MNKFTRLAVLCVSMAFPCLAAAAEFPVDRPVAEDTPASTVAGNPFTVPAGWSVSVKGPATIMTPPEGGSHIVYVDVEAEDAESAIAKAWAAYKEPSWPLKLVDEQADDNGWSRRKRFEYQTSPNERRGVVAGAMFADGRWTVWIYDVADEVGGKRSAAINLMFESLLPKGYERESFADMKAHELDDARIAELTGFIERGLEVSGVPGTSVGIIQNGEVVFSGGFGVRELGDARGVKLPRFKARDRLALVAFRQETIEQQADGGAALAADLVRHVVDPHGPPVVGEHGAGDDAPPLVRRRLVLEALAARPAVVVRLLVDQLERPARLLPGRPGLG